MKLFQLLGLAERMVIRMFGVSDKSILSNSNLADKARRMLDSALKIDESSASHAYNVVFNLENGYFDVIFNVPTSFALDSDLHNQIQKILIGGFYPLLLIYSSNAPEIVATGSGDFSTARAFRYWFKVGQFQRLRFKNLDEPKMIGSKIQLMKGYSFDLYGASGMVALSGASGNGKTALLCYLLASVLNSMPNSKIRIIDPKLDFALHNFAKSRDLDYISPAGNMNDFMNDVKSVLSHAIDEIHRRQNEVIKTGKLVDPPMIIALDEAMAVGASITDTKAVKQYQALITQITLMGRSARVFLFTSAQTFDASSVMNSSARDQMSLKIILSANPTPNDCRFLFKDFDPSTTVVNHDGFSKGLGLASTQPENRVVPFMAPFIEDFGG